MKRLIDDLESFKEALKLRFAMGKRKTLFRTK